MPGMISKRKFKIRTIALLLCIIICGLLFRFSRPSYDVIVLETLGGQINDPKAINNVGQVVGGLDVGVHGRKHAFIWSESEGIRDLGTLGGLESDALDINDKGEVVGTAMDPNGVYNGFLWTAESGMTNLGTFGGIGCSLCGINNRGQIIGRYRLPGMRNFGFVREADGSVIKLPMLSARSCFPQDINDKGQVVGSYIINGKSHAFYWDGESGVNFIAGKVGPSSEALEINKKGQVVGTIFEPKINDLVGFTWSKEDGLVKMTVSDVESSGDNINDSGEIAGIAETKGFMFIRAKRYNYLMTNRGSVVNLDKFVTIENKRLYIRDLNEDGWLVGHLDCDKVSPETHKINHIGFVLKPKGFYKWMRQNKQENEK